MNGKKILICNMGSLYPTIMMSQRRTLLEIFSLTVNNEVDVLTFNKNKYQSKLSKDEFIGKVKNYYAFKAINYDENFVKKNIYNFIFLLKYYLRGRRIEISKFSSGYYIKNILEIINNNKYDIIISHYWYGSFFFLYNYKYKVTKILDLHYMAEEDIVLNKKNIYYNKNHWLERRKNRQNLNYQMQILNHTDIVIPNSKSQIKILENNYPQLKFYYCPNGQDLTYYQSYSKRNYDSNTILFYGSLGSRQNTKAFDMFFDNVWPIVKIKNCKAKLLIVGNNPPDYIDKLSNSDDIIVTGFVKDVREYISQANCMILPMDIGVGFRGRVVEVMGMGIPVIGNHNALDCIGLTNEVNGFVTDDYSQMAEYAIKLMSDNKFRENISKNIMDFIKHYSIENTYNKLSKYLLSL